jgi:uncharacterized protein (DUF2249 family)
MSFWSSGGANGFTTASPLPPAFVAATAGNVRSIELTWPIVVNNWISPRCTLAAVDASANNLTLGEPCGSLLLQRAGGKSVPAPVTVEAPPGVALAPGAFYHDVSARTVYYALAADQTQAELEATATTSFVEQLVTAVNTSAHAFQGLAFSFATWAQPNRPDGYVDAQSTVLDCSAATPGCDGGQYEPQGAVAVSGSSGISFEHCTFTSIGAAWALSVDAGSSGCLVASSNFSDLSGGFLKLGSVAEAFAGGPPASWDSGSLVVDNTAFDMAIEFEGAAGLFGGYLFNATIEHNSISDAGYDGISCGWGWGASGPLPGHGGNTIRANKMDAVMSKLRDGGGVYVNGLTQDAYPSLMVDNFVTADEAVFAVLYLDNGASNWRVSNNVISNSPLAWSFFMQGCCNLPAYNSSVDHVWWEQPMLPPQNNCAEHGCTVDEATIYELAAGAPWPADAQAIVDAAGACAQQPTWQ